MFGRKKENIKETPIDWGARLEALRCEEKKAKEEYEKMHPKKYVEKWRLIVHALFNNVQNATFYGDFDKEKDAKIEMEKISVSKEGNEWIELNLKYHCPDPIIIRRKDITYAELSSFKEEVKI